jgi:multiple antibiotic resistance protein
MDAVTKSFLLLFVLLNPFILSVYLFELIQSLSFLEFARQLARAAWISFVVFVAFAWGGDALFEEVLQIRFAAFLIFGGVTFLVVGVRLIVGSGPPVDALSPRSGGGSAAIAMPFIVGPGTISASVVAGSRLDPSVASLVIAAALSSAIAAILAIKWLHDFVRTRNESLIARYSEIAGRVTALFTGSFAIEMILTGIERWLDALSVS